MRRWSLVLVAVLGCGGGQRRVDDLDTRVSAIESVEAKRQRELEQRIDEVARRLEVVMQQLGELGALGGVAVEGGEAGALAALQAQVDVLRAEVDTLKTARPAPRPRRPEPDGKDVFAVPLDGAPVDGPADALVTIVRGYEYACPFCEKSRPTLAELRRLYPDDVRIVYRHFIVHPQVATEPALAACAAHQQGLFFEMDRILWDKAYAQRKFDRAYMEQLGAEIGANLDQLRADMDGMCQNIIADDQADLAKVGQGATPTFYVNGRYLSGAQPVPAFTKVIDEELALAQTRIKKKKDRASYYKTWVLKKGKAAFKPEPAP